MRGSNLARTLVCAWVLWQSFYANNELAFVKLMGPMSPEACLAQVAVKAPYEKRVTLMRGYQEITKEARELHPSGVWYVCFPSDHDPRDNAGKSGSTSVTPSPK